VHTSCPISDSVHLRHPISCTDVSITSVSMYHVCLYDVSMTDVCMYHVCVYVSYASRIDVSMHVYVYMYHVWMYVCIMYVYMYHV